MLQKPSTAKKRLCRSTLLKPFLNNLRSKPNKTSNHTKGRQNKNRAKTIQYKRKSSQKACKPPCNTKRTPKRKPSSNTFFYTNVPQLNRQPRKSNMQMQFTKDISQKAETITKPRIIPNDAKKTRAIQKDVIQKMRTIVNG